MHVLVAFGVVWRDEARRGETMRVEASRRSSRGRCVEIF
jgi:hypothetical protein